MVVIRKQDKRNLAKDHTGHSAFTAAGTTWMAILDHSGAHRYGVPKIGHHSKAKNRPNEGGWACDGSQPGRRPGNPGFLKSEAVAYPSELFP